MFIIINNIITEMYLSRERALKSLFDDDDDDDNDGDDDDDDDDGPNPNF